MRAVCRPNRIRPSFAASCYMQFNTILQTRDTARGLIVNMSDVLFDTAQYSLKPGAREKLAKVSGIILGHPGLKIAVEGYTDSVGGDEYNMKLSENRANCGPRLPGLARAERRQHHGAGVRKIGSGGR